MIILFAMGMRFVLIPLLMAAGIAGPLEKLAADAPFRQSNDTTAGTLSDWELRGAVQIGDHHLLSLFDPTTGRSHWIAEGEERAGLKALSYDFAEKTAKVQYGGRTLRLPLKVVENRSK